MIELQDGESAKVSNVRGVTKIDAAGEIEPPPRHSDFTDIRDFGAIGGGDHDDGPAIQAALDSGLGIKIDGRGPWRTNQKLLWRNNSTLLGLAGARLQCHDPAGGLGVADDAPPLQFLRVEGIELTNESGDGRQITLGLNDLTKRGYPTGKNHPIDMVTIKEMKLIRAKTLLNSKGGRVWFMSNLIESHNLDLDIYAICCELGNGQNHNSPDNDPSENGMRIKDNQIRVRLKPPANNDFGGDVDLLKVTGTLARMRIHDNDFICLNGDQVEAQLDGFTGLGDASIRGNYFDNVALHWKQNGQHGGLQHIDVWAGTEVVANKWRWTTSKAGFHHGPIFCRGGGFALIAENWADIDTDGRPVHAITCDNTAPAVDTGFGSGSPCEMQIERNRAWLRGRDDHLFLQIQGSGQGAPYGYIIGGNKVRSPTGQRVPTADIAAARKVSLGMNQDLNSPAWQLGPDSKDAGGNIFGR